ncbi:MAG: branched-chain amino acid aminotransferase [Bdellovibrionales bacterium]
MEASRVQFQSSHSTKIKTCNALPPLEKIENPKFGTVFAPHMLHMEILNGDYTNAQVDIRPYGPEPMEPSSVVLHYGQSIFEGMKAFYQADGSVGVFRVDSHAKRFAQSCRLMSMPPMPEELFTKCVMEYVKFERASVPEFADHALYLRPMMYGSDSKIKMGRSDKYSFRIIASVAGNYFHGRGITGAKVLVNREFIRAYPGGLGEAKTAANYASSLGPLDYAAKLGCDQLLYLNAVGHDFVDELGGMNFFMVRDGALVTPPLTGTILNGVTRKSILEMAPSIGLKASEEPISFTKLREDILSGRVTECFACGTAAVVQPLRELLYQEKTNAPTESLKLSPDFTVATKILEKLKKIQRGESEAPGRWIWTV